MLHSPFSVLESLLSSWYLTVSHRFINKDKFVLWRVFIVKKTDSAGITITNTIYYNCYLFHITWLHKKTNKTKLIVSSISIKHSVRPFVRLHVTVTLKIYFKKLHLRKVNLENCLIELLLAIWSMTLTRFKGSDRTHWKASLK